MDAGVRLSVCTAHILELTALRGRTADLERLAAARGVPLAAPGHIAVRPRGLTLSVRPGRWLLLTAPAAGGAGTTSWQEAARYAAVVDLSSAYAAWLLCGSAVRDMLARACRLDLAAEAFPEGHAAATIMVQVSVILAALGEAMLFLTPATTARHMHEWLVTTSQPFGLVLAPETAVTDVCGDDRI